MATEHLVFGPDSQPAKMHDKMMADAAKAAAPKVPRPPRKVLVTKAVILGVKPTYKKT